MRYFILALLTTFLLSAEKVEVAEVGRYKLEVTTYMSKKGTTYIVETVFDTKEGKVIKRQKIVASKYKLPYKDRKGRMVTSD